MMGSRGKEGAYDTVMMVFEYSLLHPTDCSGVLLKKHALVVLTILWPGNLEFFASPAKNTRIKIYSVPTYFCLVTLLSRFDVYCSDENI